MGMKKRFGAAFLVAASCIGGGFAYAGPEGAMIGLVTTLFIGIYI